MCQSEGIDDPIRHVITCKGLNDDGQLPPVHDEDVHDTQIDNKEG